MSLRSPHVQLLSVLTLTLLMFSACDNSASPQGKGGGAGAVSTGGAVAGEGAGEVIAGEVIAGDEAGDEAGSTPNLDPEGVAPGPVDPLELQEHRTVGFSAFMTSSACALCHSNTPQATAMRTPEGDEIAPFNLWQGSMMANASRDPLWWAQVSAEVSRAPDQQEEIEGACVRCHAPMLSESARSGAGREGTMRDLKMGTQPAALGLDGVACTTCHQILPDNFGTTASFSGGFMIGQERKIFGPHRNPAPGPMINHVNYTPTYGDHVRDSQMCATCHTLLHPLSEADGGGYFAEQTPYLEWKNSLYNDEVPDASPEAKSCQDCHVPIYDDQGVELRTRIARSPPGGDFNINPRSPFGQHFFVGANTLIPQILKAERATLRPQATDEAFDLTTSLAERRLASSTALEVLNTSAGERDGLPTINFEVKLTSFAGHKVPTGFPARRAWLLVELTDANGIILAHSGAYDQRGRILKQSGEVLESEKAFGPVEPHYSEITSVDQVQIYEAVMRDAQGKPTTSLIEAKGWAKDNRLLPQGYRFDHSEAAYTNPVGVEGDESFVAGGDTTRYALPLPANSQLSGATLTVRLVYQTLSARYARGLFQHETPEVAAFRTMYERADAKPFKMVEVSVTLP